MRSAEVIRIMARNAGIGHRQLSRDLGKADTYIGATLSRGSDVKVETLAAIARQCGYRLIVEDEQQCRRYQVG